MKAVVWDTAVTAKLGGNHRNSRRRAASASLGLLNCLNKAVSALFQEIMGF